MSRAHDRYLCVISILKERYLCVRAVDVAHYLGVSKASVSMTIRHLREQGFIESEPDGNLLLTAKGRRHADHLQRRVDFFRRLLSDAGVEPETALRDAISFSWEMSENSFAAFCAMKKDG